MATLSIVSWMAIHDISKLRSLQRIRKRQLSPTHLACMHTGGCPFAFVIPLPHFNDVCLAFSAITVYGESFEECLINLETILHRCIEKNLVLNWEKCYFMVNEGIVLGHIISEKGIEVDKEKVYLISKLPPPTNVKTVRQILGHAGFYKRLIQDF